MNRWKFFGALFFLIVFILGAAAFFGMYSLQKQSLISEISNTGFPSGFVVPSVPTPGNAFVPVAQSDIVLPVLYTIATAPSSSGVGATNLVGKKNGISSTLSSSSPISTVAPSPAAQNVSPSLPLPDVPDAAVAIDASGASSPLEYVTAFTKKYKEVAFDMSRFNGTLKDENGIPLFILPLVEKARTDNDFSEIRDSLKIQRDFANADISFMKSIQVSSGAVAFDKKLIGTEELTVQLADRALAVSSGSLSREDFESFYNSFLGTIEPANAEYEKDIQGALSAKSPYYGPIDGLLSVIDSVAYADVPGLTTPFGGKITTIEYTIYVAIVTIGPPRPAVTTIPYAFLATPLFFMMKSLIINSWCLGIYQTESGYVIMMGTSLPIP